MDEGIALIAGLELFELVVVVGVVWIGAFVRGVTGFASSMIYAVGLTFVLPAVEVVPLIMILEMITTIWMLPRVWRIADWRGVGLIAAGCAIALPLGFGLLTILPRAPSQAVIAAVVLGVCLMLWSGFKLKKQPGAFGTMGFGVISGIMTGVTSAGGPPAIIYFFAGPAPVAVARASLIAYLGVADIMAIGVASADGLIVSETFMRAAVATPSILIASLIGTMVFHRMNPDRFRQWVIVILACVSLAGLIRAIVAMLA